MARRARRSSLPNLLLPLLATVLMAAPRVADAFSCRPALIPNGTVNSCSNCHFNPGGGGARNVFGQLVDTVAVSCDAFWSPAIAALDSDGDGLTNGEELQDPLGEWIAGQADPGNPALVSLPGDASSPNTPTPTASPTASPSASPTASPTASPSPGTPTPSPSPSPTPSGNPPQILRQTGDQVLLPGALGVLGVEAIGDPPLVYQWVKNAIPIPAGLGGAQAFLPLPPGDRAGIYGCRVSNGAGQDVITPVQVTDAPPGTLDSATVVSVQAPTHMLPGGSAPVVIVMRNDSAVTWGFDYDLFEVSDPSSLFEQTPDLDLDDPVDVVPIGGTKTFSLELKAPTTPGAHSASLRMTHLQYDGVSILPAAFGPSIPISITVGNEFDIDLTQGPAGWIGGVLFGGGSTSTNASGLCMTAPATGNNLMGWFSPERYIPLIDRSAYRVDLHLTTNQTLADAIPFMDFVYDNWNASGFGNTYLGQSFFLDVAGGASGIGRPQGRDTFRTWIAPATVEAMQWRGLIDPDDSAFTTFIDAWNDMRLIVRILDLDSAGIAADQDSGRICLSRIRVLAHPLHMIPSSVLFAPAITNQTYAPETSEQIAIGGGSAIIDDGLASARYVVAPNGNGTRKTLFPFDVALFDPGNPGAFAPLYPVTWTSDALYRTTMLVRSDVAGPEGSDPVDAIVVNMDTATHELVSVSGVVRGSPPDNMFLAASPRLTSSTGGVAQPYVGLLYGNNRTAVLPEVLPDAARLRPMGDFFNLLDIAGDQSGQDPFAVDSIVVESLSAP